MFKIRFHFRFCPFLIHKHVFRQPNISNILANPFFSCNDEMRKMDFATGTEKKISLVKAQRFIFVVVVIFCVFWFCFICLTKELIDVLLTQLSTQSLLKGTLTLHEPIIYMLNFCALSFLH